MRWIQAIVLGCALALSACGGGGRSAPAPQGFTAVAGDGEVVLDWTSEPGLEYWILFAPGSAVDDQSWARTAGGNAVVKVQPPYTLGGLVNGVQYAFAVNARQDGGPGGPSTPSVALTPRPAGAQWSALPSVGSSRLLAASFGLVSSTTGSRLLVGGEDGVLRSSADGSTWVEIQASRSAIRALTLAYGKVLIAGDQGVIAHSTDLGSFTAVSTGVSTALRALATGGGRTLAVGDAGVILSTTDGLSWSRVDSGTPLDLHGLVYSPAGYWVVVGANGLVLRSADGTAWTRVDTAAAQSWQAVTVMAVTETVDAASTLRYRLIAVGPQGQLGTSTDGQSWQLTQIEGAPTLHRVVASAGRVVAVGAEGRAFFSPNGLNWEAAQTPQGADLWALTRFGNSWRAFGDQGRQLVSR